MAQAIVPKQKRLSTSEEKRKITHRAIDRAARRFAATLRMLQTHQGVADLIKFVDVIHADIRKPNSYLRGDDNSAALVAIRSFNDTVPYFTSRQYMKRVEADAAAKRRAQEREAKLKGKLDMVAPGWFHAELYWSLFKQTPHLPESGIIRWKSRRPVRGRELPTLSKSDLRMFEFNYSIRRSVTQTTDDGRVIDITVFRLELSHEFAGTQAIIFHQWLPHNRVRQKFCMFCPMCHEKVTAIMMHMDDFRFGCRECTVNPRKEGFKRLRPANEPWLVSQTHGVRGLVGPKFSLD